MGQYPLGQWPQVGFSATVGILPVQGALLSPMISPHPSEENTRNHRSGLLRHARHHHKQQLPRGGRDSGAGRIRVPPRGARAGDVRDGQVHRGSGRVAQGRCEDGVAGRTAGTGREPVQLHPEHSLRRPQPRGPGLRGAAVRCLQGLHLCGEMLCELNDDILRIFSTGVNAIWNTELFVFDGRCLARVNFM